MDFGAIVARLDVTSGLSGQLAGAACWGYLILALTTLPPLLPNATLLVMGGVLAARGQMSLTLVLVCVAGGALLGDLLIHRAGLTAGEPMRRRLHGRRRRKELLDWTAERMHRGGIPFVVAVRFLPSGRLIGGLAAGIARYPARRFALGAAIAEVIWAGYSVGVGYFSWAVTADPLQSVGLGLGLSLAAAALGAAAQLPARRRRPAGRSAL